VYDSALPKLAKSVLAYLCFVVNKDTGVTWVCEKTLAKKTGLALSTVKKELDRLKRLGWIERRPRPNKSTVTCLRLERFLPKEEPCGDSPEGHPATTQQPPGDPQRVAPRPQSGLISVQNSVKRSSVDDAALAPLFEELQHNGFPALTERQFNWACGSIRARAKTPPRSLAYWRKSLPGFFEHFEREAVDYLADIFAALLEEGTDYASAKDIVAEKAVERDLPYETLMQEAIEKAEARLEARRALASALNAGRGPRAAQDVSQQERPGRQESVSTSFPSGPSSDWVRTHQNGPRASEASGPDW
jgi:hypothetical protein